MATTEGRYSDTSLPEYKFSNFEQREVELLVEEGEIDAARQIIGDRQVADEVLPTTLEEVKQESLYLHEVRQDYETGDISAEEYWGARHGLEDKAAEYLTQNGLSEDAAEHNASDLATEVAIGIYDAIDLVDAWGTILERGVN